jgi:ribosomal protein S6--L-glutamate ligase
VAALRVGVVNRYTAEKRRRYPVGLALARIGATYVPIDVREISASLGAAGTYRVTVAGAAGQPGSRLEDLDLDGIAWRVSEDAFNAYADIQRLLAQRHVLVNAWACARICANKWQTSLRLAAAGIPVIPTILLVPGMQVPAFNGAETVIKPCVGAGGRGVRTVKSGTDPMINEPHVAQPLLSGDPGENARALVCGFSSVLAMSREPGRRSKQGAVPVNNLAAGGIAARMAADPIRDIALAAAECLDGDLLGVDLVRRNGEWAILEVNASPGLDGIARVADEDCYRIAAEAILSRLKGRRTRAVISEELCAEAMASSSNDPAPAGTCRSGAAEPVRGRAVSRRGQVRPHPEIHDFHQPAEVVGSQLG